MSNQRYPTDLTDEQWEILKPLIPPAKHGGRHRTVNIREVINAIFYINRGGGSWRLMPKDFGPWSTAYDYYRKWTADGTWERIHHALRDSVRLEAGKEITPSAAIIDSQSIKTTNRGGIRGYDAGKKINGRKRHIVVNTLGLILMVMVHAGNIQARDGAKKLLCWLSDLFPSIKIIWADGGYAGKLLQWAKELGGALLEIVKRSEKEKGFKVLPKRWIVERTFGWLGHFRRRVCPTYPTGLI